MTTKNDKIENYERLQLFFDLQKTSHMLLLLIDTKKLEIEGEKKSFKLKNYFKRLNSIPEVPDASDSLIDSTTRDRGKEVYLIAKNLIDGAEIMFEKCRNSLTEKDINKIKLRMAFNQQYFADVKKLYNFS